MIKVGLGVGRLGITGGAATARSTWVGYFHVSNLTIIPFLFFLVLSISPNPWSPPLLRFREGSISSQAVFSAEPKFVGSAGPQEASRPEWHSRKPSIEVPSRSSSDSLHYIRFV